MKSQWWFAKDVFDGEFSRLQVPSQEGIKDRFFKDAQRLTITVAGAWVREDMDGGFKGDNDVIIATRHQVGSRPIVDKLHFLKQEVPERHWEGSFFHPVVYATSDFREDVEEIAIQVRVYDEDGLNEEEAKGLTGAIAGAGGAAALAFPAFAPYAGLATGLGTSLVSLIDNLDDHDEIVEGRIRLGVNKPADQAHDLLQPGFLVCFSAEVDASKLMVGQDRKVYYRSTTNDAKQYEGLSYIVLRVERSFLSAPDLVIELPPISWTGLLCHVGLTNSQLFFLSWGDVSQ